MVWLEGGNNEMLKGLTHGFLWASLVIPKSETNIWTELRDKSRRMTSLEALAEKPQNIPSVFGVAAWINEDPELKEKYVKSYSLALNKAHLGL